MKNCARSMIGFFLLLRAFLFHATLPPCFAFSFSTCSSHYYYSSRQWRGTNLVRWGRIHNCRGQKYFSSLSLSLSLSLFLALWFNSCASVLVHTCYRLKRALVTSYKSTCVDITICHECVKHISFLQFFYNQPQYFEVICSKECLFPL